MNRDDDYLWNPAAPVDPAIAEIERVLRPLRFEPGSPSFGDVGPSRTLPWRLWSAAAAVLVFLLIGYAVARARLDPWAVRALAGVVQIEGAAVPLEGGSTERLAAGQWLETDGGSRAELRIGAIGKAEFGPDSRVQLVRAEAREHRLALQRGTMHARVWAPPRFFLVETATALAVDLGCVYTLTVDESGYGELSVESGEVELVQGAARALVPAGNLVSIAPGVGPGLPLPVGAAPAFRQAVAAMEADFTDPAALLTLFRLADATHSITLWHLLQRVPDERRPAVASRLEELMGVPPAVEVADVIALQPRALGEWREALQSRWREDQVPGWKRLWRRAWTFALTVG